MDPDTTVVADPEPKTTTTDAKPEPAADLPPVTDFL